MTDQPKEWYQKFPGFTIKSGTVDAKGRPTDLSFFTDRGQGFQYTQDGDKTDICHGTSYEICNVDGNGQSPAKIIRGANGDIIIEALAGELVLRARSIRIEATDGTGEVTINSNKQISLTSPIQNIKGTNVNIVGTNNVSTGALIKEGHGDIQNSQTSGTDETQGSLLNKILTGIKKFNKFLGECLG